jgi:polysaccharide pyruvyl transferase WcaK-like protein
VLNGAGLVFSTRMHGAIMALSQAVPPLCVCWQPKIRGLYADLDLEELLQEIDQSGRFDTREALRMIAEITENRKRYVAGIEERLSALRGQYNRLWAV